MRLSIPPPKKYTVLNENFVFNLCKFNLHGVFQEHNPSVKQDLPVLSLTFSSGPEMGCLFSVLQWVWSTRPFISNTNTCLIWRWRQLFLHISDISINYMWHYNTEAEEGSTLYKPTMQTWLLFQSATWKYGNINPWWWRQNQAPNQYTPTPLPNRMLQKATFVEHCLFANIKVQTDDTYSLLFTVVFSSLSMQIDKVF